MRIGSIVKFNGKLCIICGIQEGIALFDPVTFVPKMQTWYQLSNRRAANESQLTVIIE